MPRKKKKPNSTRPAGSGNTKSFTDHKAAFTNNMSRMGAPSGLAVPILETGMHVEANSELALFSDIQMTKVVDTVPVSAIVQVMFQDSSRRDIIGISFGIHVGFVNIVDLRMHRIVVDPKPKRAVQVDFRQLPSSTLSSPAVSAVLTKCIMKYDIAEGTVVETLFLVSVRETEKINSAKLCEVEAEMKLVVLKIGEGRRVLVRPLAPGTPVGWVSAIDSKGRPLLGYRVTPKEMNYAEIGARLEVKSKGILYAGEEADSEIVENNVGRGTIVRVLQVPSMHSTELRVKVKTDPTNLTGWLPIVSQSNEVIIGDFAKDIDEDVETFHDAVKRNNVDQMVVMIEGLKKKWFLRGGRKPVISDVNVSDGQMKSALHYACAYGHVEATQYLVESKLADVNMLDQFKRTAMHYAARRMPGSPTLDRGCVIQLLRNYRANPNEEDADGGTPLMYAAEKNRFCALKLLLDLRANLNHTNLRRESALSYAAKQGHFCLMHHLLSLKADPNVSVSYAPTASAAPQAASPAPQAASPAPQAASPAPQAASPAPQAASPAPQAASPAPQAASPAPQAAAPTGKGSSRKSRKKVGKSASFKSSSFCEPSKPSRPPSASSRKSSARSGKSSKSVALRPSTANKGEKKPATRKKSVSGNPTWAL